MQQSRTFLQNLAKSDEKFAFITQVDVNSLTGEQKNLLAKKLVNAPFEQEAQQLVIAIIVIVGARSNPDHYLNQLCPDVLLHLFSYLAPKARGKHKPEVFICRVGNRVYPGLFRQQETAQEQKAIEPSNKPTANATAWQCSIL